MDETYRKIETLLELHPDSIKARTKRGDTPLLLACFNGVHMDLLEVLHDRYPEAAARRIQEPRSNHFVSVPMEGDCVDDPGARVSAAFADGVGTGSW